ncbi:MAG: DUF4390 domain-containing protein [Magnetococcales bacterium]|nr:DUF4390 domain-containing protein [Magnetococcales bacterium]
MITIRTGCFMEIIPTFCRSLAGRPASQTKETPTGIAIHRPCRFSFAALTFFILSSLLLGGCGDKNQLLDENPITEATAFIQGGDLYARAKLNAEFSKKIIAALRHGEPIQTLFRFSFYRHQRVLPNLPLAKVIVKKQIHLRLVTQKYEMHDVSSGQIRYTPDEEEAIRFFGNPRFVLLGREVHLQPEFRYGLKVDFDVDYQGMSPLFRTLKQWLTLDRSEDYHFQVDFNQP